MNSYITQYQTHLDYIKQALQKNKIFLFIGAGLSLNADKKTMKTAEQFKSWQAFMEQLGEKLWPDLYGQDYEEFLRKISDNYLLIWKYSQKRYSHTQNGGMVSGKS